VVETEEGGETEKEEKWEEGEEMEEEKEGEEEQEVGEEEEEGEETEEEEEKEVTPKMFVARMGPCRTHLRDCWWRWLRSGSASPRILRRGMPCVGVYMYIFVCFMSSCIFLFI